MNKFIACIGFLFLFSLLIVLLSIIGETEDIKEFELVYRGNNV